MDWYEKNKRELPFRSSNNPYYIWVSEIMAQQTQINTMLPYYERWIAAFPDIKALANADIEDVLKLWEGLGYYNRARNLHKGACFVIENFEGTLPHSKSELMTIPGIGEYTSSAIAAIAFNEPEIAIDGNVKRVMARFLNYTENVNTRKAHVYFENYLKEKLKIGNAQPRYFVQALMELGALVYTPGNTQCENSPFKELCACYRGENVGTIPYIPKAKKAKVIKMTVFVYIEDGKILISSDDQDGLMKGLTRLPQVEGHLDEKPLLTFVHKFSHIHWDIQVQRTHTIMESEFYKLIPIEQLDDLAIVGAHNKILAYLMSEKIL